jgi:type II secretory pathway predicted ATPase ExeA
MKTTPPFPVDPTRAFQPTADPASFWLTGQYDDALRMLRSAALGRQGLLVLVGETGTGKTVLAQALATRLRDDTVVVGRLLYPILEGMDLLATGAEAFGLSIAFRDQHSFVEQFRQFVAETLAAGRRVLLVVDEAHRLSRELLIELARLPYADGTNDAASLSVLLVGQRGLLAALREESLEPDVLCHLRPLTREQTAEYVAHHVQVLRRRGRLFTPSALRKIWVVSEGVPEVINALCLDALSRLRDTGRRTVTAAMIDPAPREADETPIPETALSPIEEPPPSQLPPPRPARPVRRRLRASLVGAACIVLALVAIWAVKRTDRVPFLAGPVETTASPVTDAAVEGEAGAAAPAKAITEAALESNPAGTSAPPTPDLPERPERPVPVASKPRAAAAPPRSGRATADHGDGTLIIEWLLDKQRPAGGVR